ncbi:MAG: TonB-dependent receptor [Marinilabiliaceae bacterium]|nr:TonB-dependent receptor [Marinilabiliaceae bacterium]
MVKNNIVEKSAQVGESPGLIKLNPYIANYLPGNGDNSVFNLLRLQPGILAAGEQPNDLIIWGSPEGTSRVFFDGFTIWGLKNFNDNISAVNPYLAKNVNVSKGGYGVTHEDVVGGIVNITGKNGSTQQSGFNFFVNNQTVNGMVELPLFKKSSLILAFRKTYNNLFDEDDLKIFGSQNTDQGQMETDIFPDYEFRDFNVKYALHGDNGDLFYISFLGAKDHFAYEAERELNNNSVLQSSQEDNTQSGATIYYGKNWKSGTRSHFKMSYSALKSAYDLNREVENRWNGRIRSKLDEHADTDVEEFITEANNEWRLSDKHQFQAGMGITQNTIRLVEDTFDVVYVDIQEKVNRLHLFTQDQFSLGSNVKLIGGLRFNYAPNLKKGFVDPRLSVNIRTLGYLKFNLAWGRYHQFLVKSSVLDESGNYRYRWSIANNEDIPVMTSMHWVGGVAWSRDKFTASIDGYYKETEGLTRYIRYWRIQDIFEGVSRSYGVDFFAKQDIGHHSVWASYSLGKTEELFSYFPESDYRRAPQDQRHEFKLAGLVNLKYWHFSANYVYGSGFPLYTNYLKQEYTEPDYNRVDASLTYKLSSKKFMGEVGFSILNLLDANNVKYASFTKVPIDQINTVYINSESVGFTPLLYVKVGF